MIHLWGKQFGFALCGAELKDEDSLTAVALESSCEHCRSKVFVGFIGQRGCAVQEHREWFPEPMEGAEAIVEEVRKRRGT